MTDRTKNWAEMAADCAIDAASATDHDEAMEWIGLGVASALLAIHDALTAKHCDCAKQDAYAAREAEQREATERDPDPDPLDESNHRDRLDGRGVRIRKQLNHWCDKDPGCIENPIVPLSLEAWNGYYPPLTFASEPPQDGPGDDLTASGDEGGPVEGSDPDPLDESNHRDRIDGDGDRLVRTEEGFWVWSDFYSGYAGSLAVANASYGPLTFAPDTAPQEAVEPDPLDEDDHRDRFDADGDRIVRVGHKHWHTPGYVNCHLGEHGHSLEDWNTPAGPLTFAPDTAPQETPSAPQTASGDEGGPVEGSAADDAQEPLLCPECGGLSGDSIDEHNARGCRYVMCDCQLSPSDIARALIAEAVKAERKKMAEELREVTR